MKKKVRTCWRWVAFRLAERENPGWMPKTRPTQGPFLTKMITLYRHRGHPPRTTPAPYALNNTYTKHTYIHILSRIFRKYLKSTQPNLAKGSEKRNIFWKTKKEIWKIFENFHHFLKQFYSFIKFYRNCFPRKDCEERC